MAWEYHVQFNKSKAHDKGLAQHGTVALAVIHVNHTAVNRGNHNLCPAITAGVIIPAPVR